VLCVLIHPSGLLPCHMQISKEELRSAMTFLREQMGEEELRTMLETLDAEAGTAGGIDVSKLMDLALGDKDEE